MFDCSILGLEEVTRSKYKAPSTKYEAQETKYKPNPSLLS
jgi:hypothetical protein